ncbi:MAG: DNA-3-methyladenine glycosylase 2 family protein [Euryarchaeota archaeon TMED99]|nr:MAG: DNA-3-methyladenine glycosylase 2 family protein [Euryarchaeota archaeon TMED99]|tara:strand:+ start:589 stop:1200 length:612 start_codon:yes stop_codon:yes gene_type:complete
MQTGKPTWWDEANAVLSNDEILGPVVRSYPDESLVGRGDLFSTLVRSIVGQQISVIAADAVWGRLVDLVGDITPESLRKFTPEQLASCGLSRPKSSYIHGLALEAKALILDNWDELNDEQLLKHFIQFRGVGPWTAEMILIFTLMRPDIFSIGDIGLIRAVQKLVPEAETKEEVLEISQRWAPYRTAASWYLWRMLDPVPVEY